GRIDRTNRGSRFVIGQRPVPTRCAGFEQLTHRIAVPPPSGSRPGTRVIPCETKKTCFSGITRSLLPGRRSPGAVPLKVLLLACDSRGERALDDDAQRRDVALGNPAEQRQLLFIEETNR